jgi:hypothetical protein
VKQSRWCYVSGKTLGVIVLVVILLKGQFAHSTSGWPDGPCKDVYTYNRLCELSLTPCCPDLPNECTSTDIECGYPYNTQCYGKKLLAKRAYGTNCGRSLGASGCTIYTTLYCCRFQLYDESICVTEQCWLYTGYHNACPDPFE